jgi:hypothetical protein
MLEAEPDMRSPSKSWVCLAVPVWLASCALSACVGAPDGSPDPSAEKPLVQRSDQGLVDATLTLQGGALDRGPHDFLVGLRATRGDSAAVLMSATASMPAHGHQVGAQGIVRDGDGFRIEQLDLFMSGRWDVALGVEVDATSDVIELALDVP